MQRIYLQNDIRRREDIVMYDRFIGWTFHTFKVGDFFRKKIRLYNTDLKKYQKITVLMKVMEERNGIIECNVVSWNG